jgi:hypothetical protein
MKGKYKENQRKETGKGEEMRKRFSEASSRSPSLQFIGHRNYIVDVILVITIVLICCTAVKGSCMLHISWGMMYCFQPFGTHLSIDYKPAANTPDPSNNIRGYMFVRIIHVRHESCTLGIISIWPRKAALARVEYRSAFTFVLNDEFFDTVVLLIKDYWFDDCGQSKIFPVRRSIGLVSW